MSMLKADTPRGFTLTKATPAMIEGMAEQKKIGRPSKGTRDSGILAKPHSDFGKIIRANADAEGLSYGDYLVKLAAERLGLLEYAPVPASDRMNEIRQIREMEAATAAA